MSPNNPEFQKAVQMLRGGDHYGAILAANRIVHAEPGNLPALKLLGIAYCQTGNFENALPVLKKIVSMSPPDIGARIALAQALAQANRSAEAIGELDAAAQLGASVAEYWWAKGDIQKGANDSDRAIESYQRAVALNQNLFQVWNNLGNLLRDRGRLPEALDALDRAARLQPNNGLILLNLGRAQVDLSLFDAASRSFLQAQRLLPTNPEPQIELAAIELRNGNADAALGLLSAAEAMSPNSLQFLKTYANALMFLRMNAEAEAVLRRVISLNPRYGRAYVDLIKLVEVSNKLNEVEQLIVDARAAGVPDTEMGLAYGLIEKRRGRLSSALNHVEGFEPEDSQSRISKFQELGELYDRLGRSNDAIMAFAERGRRISAEPLTRKLTPEGYNERVSASNRLLSKEWAGAWSPPIQRSPADPQPVFLVGFPRSGTTLLDTSLFGHDDVDILEEGPFLSEVDKDAGDISRWPSIEHAQISNIRRRYFERTRAAAKKSGARVVIDKLPLNIARTALIYRIFPDAKILLSIRHPFDSVLSCFMQNFQPNEAMVNFLTLEGGAKTYDLVMTHWARCIELFPISFLPIRYEDLVSNQEGVLRSALEYLNLPWSETVLKHDQTALSRGFIGTPSYNQVSEKLYTRSIDRWRKYEAHMMPHLGRLAPWIEYFGYEPVEPKS